MRCEFTTVSETQYERPKPASGLLQKMSRGIAYRRVNGIFRPFEVFDVPTRVKAALCLVAAKMVLAVFYEKQRRHERGASVINTTWKHAFDRDEKGSVDYSCLRNR
jgi:hypothetical protein